jgi:FKBP-type peptidyl-prolyl cis-trans isomerase
MRSFSTITAIGAVVLVAGCKGGQTAELRTFADSASYAVGVNMGSSVREVKDEIALPALIQGLNDAFEGREPKLTQAQAQQVLQTLTSRLREHASSDRTAQAATNQKEGEAFLAKNAAKSGVTTTPSGLQFEVLTPGTGPHPKATDRVTVNYRGTLVDGNEFDSSYSRGQPATFAVNEVIPGWTEGLQLMQVGGKYRLVVPSTLGYGQAGSGPDIGPNATLVFEVELLKID